VHDLHPGYHSTRLALESGLAVVAAAQHQHAHIAAVLAEFGRTDPVLGVAYDGTGYGDDGRIWGAELLFADLHPSLSWSDQTLVIDKQHDEEIEPEGRGLVLIPAVFDWPGIAVLVDFTLQPTLSYSPRGIAEIWDEPEDVRGDGAMDDLIGGTRADIMRVLNVPMTTSELAQRLHLTPAAVSQQLGVLRRSGVVDARRQGREVYSELTASGRRLLDLLG